LLSLLPLLPQGIDKKYLFSNIPKIRQDIFH
jgi:hypothetical protein